MLSLLGGMRHAANRCGAPLESRGDGVRSGVQEQGNRVTKDRPASVDGESCHSSSDRPFAWLLVWHRKRSLFGGLHVAEIPGRPVRLCSE
jgi:hypothetical protein